MVDESFKQSTLVGEVGTVCLYVKIYFSTTTSDAPFFSNLSNALLNIPTDVPANLKSMERFITFIYNHIAFLSALSRSNLIYNLMRVYMALSPNEQANLWHVLINILL
jgi:hypothetical protein